MNNESQKSIAKESTKAMTPSKTLLFGVKHSQQSQGMVLGPDPDLATVKQMPLHTKDNNTPERNHSRTDTNPNNSTQDLAITTTNPLKGTLTIGTTNHTPQKTLKIMGLNVGGLTSKLNLNILEDYIMITLT